MNISECYITIVLRGFVLLGLFRLHLFCCSLPTSIILKYSKTKMEHQNVSKIIHQRTYLVFAKQTSNSKLDFVSNSWQEAHKYVEMWGEEEGSDTKLMTFLQALSAAARRFVVMHGMASAMWQGKIGGVRHWACHAEGRSSVPRQQESWDWCHERSSAGIRENQEMAGPASLPLLPQHGGRHSSRSHFSYLCLPPPMGCCVYSSQTRSSENTFVTMTSKNLTARAAGLKWVANKQPHIPFN